MCKYLTRVCNSCEKTHTLCNLFFDGIHSEMTQIRPTCYVLGSTTNMLVFFSGAFGYFEVTNDITKYTKARVFESVGKKTPIAIRFSTVGGESGSADTARDPRGFAVKFYTEDGNWDLVGNNTPIFFIRDPILFPSFIHTQKRNPQTHLKVNSDIAIWSTCITRKYKFLY